MFLRMSYMAEQNEIPPNLAPSGNSAKCQGVILDIMPQSVIELSTLEFEGEDIQYIERGGVRLYPVPVVGKLYGYSRDAALQAFRRNLIFLEGNHYSFKLNGKGRSIAVPCLTGEGVLIYTSRLGTGNIPEDRVVKIVKTVQFMAKAAVAVVEQVQLGGLFNPSALTDNPKNIAKDNNLRRALFIKKVREKHPNRPNTFNKLVRLAHNDHDLIRGSVEFEQGWHKKLTKELTLKDHAQKMASFAAIACGHTEIDEINRFERDLFRGLPEKFIPDHLPGMIETTKQLQLTGGENGDFVVITQNKEVNV